MKKALKCGFVALISLGIPVIISTVFALGDTGSMLIGFPFGFIGGLFILNEITK